MTLSMQDYAKLHAEKTIVITDKNHPLYKKQAIIKGTRVNRQSGIFAYYAVLFDNGDTIELYNRNDFKFI